MFIRKYPNGLTDQFLNELTNMDFPIIYSMDVEPLDNDVAYQMQIFVPVKRKRCLVTHAIITV